MDGAEESAAEATSAEAAKQHGEVDRERDRVAEGLHDLRTPLATVRGSLETLRTAGPDLPGSVRDELLALALRNAIRLGSRLDTLADLERMHDPRTWLRPQARPLGDLVRRATDEWAGLLVEHVLQVEVPDDLHVDVAADALVHVLTTLVDNATRHSPQGTTVRVVATRIGDLARLDVSDDGPGISPEQLPGVLAALHGDAPLTEPAGSLGLGVVRRFVEVSGGSVRVIARAGEGTTVTFTLPLADEF